MRRQVLAWSLVLLLCLGFSACGTEDQGEKNRTFLVTATDLHYLSPELTDHGETFWQVMKNGDGKVTEYCEELIDAFLAELIVAKPDSLILTGDLSFNGERASHERLAAKLQMAEDAGIPVYVLPGNHDVYRGTSASFFGDGYELVPSVSGEDFSRIYGAFGFEEALSRDTDSLSYMAQLNEGTRLLMLDANTFHDYCSLSKKTLDWAEEQLSAAKEEGVDVLAACHQNLYQHSVFRGGYMLECSEMLHQLLEDYEVPLMLSGHMHIQHILTEGTVTEIATSPLTMSACRYGLLHLDGDRIHYETRSVDLDAWAREQGIDHQDFQHFPQYALDRLRERTKTQAEGMLEGKDYDPDMAQKLINYACELNLGYFTGDLRGIPELDPEGSLQAEWENNRSSFSGYFASLAPEIGADYTRWSNGT